MLSVSQVYSNLFITNIQVLDFLRKFGLDGLGIKDDLMKVLKSNMDKEVTGRKDAYVLKDFTNYLNNSVVFRTYLNGFREELVKQIFTLQQYISIFQRIKFYYKSPGAVPPPEPFCSKINRLLFTQAPPPYKHDYGIPNPSNQTFDDMICGIKRGYAFDIRSSRMSRSCASAKSMGRLSTASNASRMKGLARVPSAPKMNRKSTKSVQNGLGILSSTRESVYEDEDKN